MQRFNEYVAKLHEQYGDIVRHVRNLVENGELSEETIQMVSHLAKTQDERYGFLNDNYTGLQKHFIDDIFELALAENCDWRSLSIEEQCVKMHDAWMLAYLYSLNETYTGLTPKEEGVLQLENLILSESHFDEHINNKGKDIVGLSFVDIDGNSCVLKVQERRLAQFVDFALLEKEEVVKDMTPTIVIGNMDASCVQFRL